MNCSKWALLFAIGVAPISALNAQARAKEPLTPKQLALMGEFSPLPAAPLDPTNAVDGKRVAARLGQALFYDKRLSRNGQVSCATCHDPGKGFADGRQLGRGLANVSRNTMALWNVAQNRWFFWDGRKDSLWSQALAPIEDHREQGFSRLELAHLVASDEAYRRDYVELFGALPELSDTNRFPAIGRPVPGDSSHAHSLAWASMAPQDQLAINRLFSNLGKSIAAYERLLVSDRSPFDIFVEGLGDGDPEKLAALSTAAQRGFVIFSGKGNCSTCHDGPNFSDRSFHSNLVPSDENTDPGRSQGILQLKLDAFNTRSEFADDAGAMGEKKLTHLVVDVHLPGSFKTPSLRNVALSAPYMREGQIASLEDVIEFYSTLDGAMDPGLKTERIIKPLHLTPGEKGDLLAFLRSLTDDSLPQELRRAPR